MSWHTTKFMGEKTQGELDAALGELEKKINQMYDDIHKKFCETKDEAAWRKERDDVWVNHHVEKHAILTRFEKLADQRGDFSIRWD